MVTAAQFFRTAPDGYAPPGWVPSAKQQATNLVRNVTLQEALTSPRWYVLWAILALNVTAGAALISVASPLAQKLTLPPSIVPAAQAAIIAATLVTTLSIFNGIGRLFW